MHASSGNLLWITGTGCSGFRFFCFILLYWSGAAGGRGKAVTVFKALIESMAWSVSVGQGHTSRKHRGGQISKFFKQIIIG